MQTPSVVTHTRDNMLRHSSQYYHFSYNIFLGYICYAVPHPVILITRKYLVKPYICYIIFIMLSFHLEERYLSIYLQHTFAFKEAWRNGSCRYDSSTVYGFTS
jgi:hypothetical protein